MSEEVYAALPRLGQRAGALAAGSRLQMAKYSTFTAACSVGKWPRALTARRSRALRLTMALVLQTMRRISTSKARNGTISAPALVHNRTIAGYLRSHVAENSANA